VLRKWVTVFAGARDSYQTAIALHESGLLQNVVTDWYSPLDTKPARMISRLLPDSFRSRLAKRYSSSLPSNVVYSLPQSRLKLPVLRSDLPSWPQVGDVLGRAAGRLAHRTHAGILAYIHTATEAFKEAGLDVPKVLFQVHPHPASVKRLLLEDDFLLDTRRQPLFDETVWPAEVLLLGAACLPAKNVLGGGLQALGSPWLSSRADIVALMSRYLHCHRCCGVSEFSELPLQAHWRTRPSCTSRWTDCEKLTRFRRDRW
jgi:hypothetical protein